MPHFTIDTNDFDLLKKRLQEAHRGIKPAVDKALKASKQYVTNKLEKDTVKPNFPAGGSYSVGKLKQSIDRDYTVFWQGTKAFIHVGYDFDKSGLTSILMIRGAPRKQPEMKKARKLKEDIYGSATKKKVIQLQEETIFKILDRMM